MRGDGQSDALTRFGIVPAYDPNQALRVKRFLMAWLVYFIAIVLMGLYVWEGFMTPEAWLHTTIAITVVNAVIYAVLRTGKNERLRDPSLTSIQMVGASVLMAFTVYQVDAARGALLLLYLILLLFGVFRLRTWQFMSLGVVALLGYALAILAVYEKRPWAVDLQVELLQFVGLAVMVPCGGFFAGYVNGLRRKLRQQQVELQQAQEKVYELATSDALTGVSHRRGIVDFLTYERERAVRLNLPLAVLLLDLDHFDGVNDELGHETGDRLLAAVAQRLRERLRNVDGLGRYAGEEFLIVMPDTEPDEAQAAAEQLRSAIESRRFSRIAPTVRLRASIGVTDYRGEEDSWAVIERARRAADAALQRGGNRTCSDLRSAATSDSGAR